MPDNAKEKYIPGKIYRRKGRHFVQASLDKNWPRFAVFGANPSSWFQTLEEAYKALDLHDARDKQPADGAAVIRITTAIDGLKYCRNLLRLANANKAADYSQRALKSAEGALRHASRMERTPGARRQRRNRPTDPAEISSFGVPYDLLP